MSTKAAELEASVDEMVSFGFLLLFYFILLLFFFILFPILYHAHTRTRTHCRF